MLNVTRLIAPSRVYLHGMHYNEKFCNRAMNSKQYADGILCGTSKKVSVCSICNLRYHIKCKLNCAKKESNACVCLQQSVVIYTISCVKQPYHSNYIYYIGQSPWLDCMLKVQKGAFSPMQQVIPRNTQNLLISLHEGGLTKTKSLFVRFSVFHSVICHMSCLFWPLKLYFLHICFMFTLHLYNDGNLKHSKVSNKIYIFTHSGY